MKIVENGALSVKIFEKKSVKIVEKLLKFLKIS